MMIDSDQELAGAAAVVTGSSSGIGRAIALELARAGADVLVHASKSADEARQVSAEIKALGRESDVVLHDLADPAAQDALVEDAWKWRNNLSVWINNAGADLLTGETSKWTYEQKLDLLLKLDVTATIRLSRLAGARMKSATGGVIVNMGWDQAEHGMAGDSGELFAAAKGAVISFSKSLTLSLAPKVRVNCLAPGWIQTAWGETASEQWQKRVVRECQLGRWGTPEDVARVARYLASDRSSFVNGQVLPVNGGFRPR